MARSERVHFLIGVDTVQHPIYYIQHSLSFAYNLISLKMLQMRDKYYNNLLRDSFCSVVFIISQVSNKPTN